MPHFIDRNFDSPLDLLRHPGAAARLLGSAASAGSVPAVRRRFPDDRGCAGCSRFQAMYAGLRAEHARSRLYAVITYMDCIEGVYFPEGGMQRGARARWRGAARRPGVDLRYGADRRPGPAPRRRRRRGRRRGSTAASSSRADAVVCTLDLPVAYERLLPDLEPRRVVPRRAATRPRPWSGTSAPAGRAATGTAPPQHPLRRGLGQLLRRADQRRAG